MEYYKVTIEQNKIERKKIYPLIHFGKRFLPINLAKKKRVIQKHKKKFVKDLNKGRLK